MTFNEKGNNDMANDVTKNPRTLLPISGRFAQAPVDDLGEGIKAAMSALSIRGGRFGINQRKVLKPLEKEDALRVEVVILRGAKTQSKTYFEGGGFEEGRRPTCWSSDSVKPDEAVENKQSPQCSGCPRDVWVTDSQSGKRKKLCSDNKRLAIVPAKDMRNEAYGGALIFRVPPTSLSNLDLYSDELKKMGIPFYAYTTFMEIGPNFKLSFEYGRPLTDDEADIVLEMRDDPRTIQMVADQIVPEEDENGFTEVPKQAATVQRIPPTQAKPVTPGVVPTAKPAQAATINAAVAKPATPPPSQRVVQTTPAAVADEETNEIEEAGQVPDELDGMFGNLFPGKN